MKRYYLLVASLLCICMATHVTAKVTWLPDYLGDNKSYGANRVNDGGSNKSEKNCATYGLLDSCGAHRVGKGTQHPIAGLTCYEECVCDTSYYKYTASNCRSPKKLSEGCSDIKKPTMVDSSLVKKDTVAELSKTLPSSSLAGSLPGALRTMKYAQCNCPSDYNLAICPINANCETCDSKHKFKNCKDGYTEKSGACVKIEDCSAYPLTVCPTGGVCSQCPDNNTKLKLDSCTNGPAWKKVGNTCEAIPCPAGYTAGVTTCSDTKKYAYSSNGYSGDKECGKCTAKKDDCPEGYWKGCADRHIETGTPKYTDAGTRCIQCRARECREYAPAGTYIRWNEIPADHKCTLIKLPLNETPENQIECYKDCKSDICPTGYGKTACTSSQKQTATTKTDAGTTCYKCEDTATCESKGYLSAKPSRNQYCTETTVNGKTCYTDCKCYIWKPMKATMSVKNDYDPCMFIENEGQISLDADKYDPEDVENLYYEWCTDEVEGIDSEGDKAAFMFDHCFKENIWLKKPNDNKFISHIAGVASSKECKQNYVRVCSQTTRNSGGYYPVNNGTWSIQGYTSASRIIEASKYPQLSSALPPNYFVVDRNRLVCYSYSIEYDIGCIFAAHDKNGAMIVEEIDVNNPYVGYWESLKYTLAYGTVKGYCNKWENIESHLAPDVDKLVCQQAIDTDENGCQAIADHKNTDETICKTLVPGCDYAY